MRYTDCVWLRLRGSFATISSSYSIVPLVRDILKNRLLAALHALRDQAAHALTKLVEVPELALGMLSTGIVPLLIRTSTSICTRLVPMNCAQEDSAGLF